MATNGGPNMTSNGLVFGYDTGYPLVSDNHESYKYFKGQPTETFDVGDMTPSSPNLFYSGSHEGGSTNLNGTLWDWYTFSNTNVSPEGGMEWHPNVQGPGFTGAWLMKKRPGGNYESNFQGNPPGAIEETASYTVSVWCKTDQASCFRIHLNVTQNGSSYWGYTSTYHSGGGNWERLSVTIPADSGNTSINTIRCQGVGTTVTADAYFRNYQVEKNSHPTPFILGGTRSVSGSLIDLTRTTDIDLTNVSFDSNAQMTFDGTDDRIDVGLYHLSGSDHSEEVVVYRNATGVQHGILSDLQYGFYGLFIGTDNKAGFKQMQQISDGQGGFSYPSVQVTSTSTLGIGYHHIISTFSSEDGFRLYINGTLEASNATDLPFNLSGGRGINHIGVYKTSDSQTYTNPWDGKIPIVRAYNRALTASEVLQNYNALKSRFGL